MIITKKQLREWIRELERVQCGFWACEGSRKDKIKNGITCRKCMVIYEMRQLINE